MSTVAKVFVVLNLVFALIYAGVAATLLQKQEHWKYKHEMEVLAHKATKTDLTDKLNNVNQEKASLAKEVDTFRSKCDLLEARIDQLTRENAGLEKKWNEMKALYDSLDGKYKALADDLAAVQGQKDELQRQLSQALAEKDDAIHRMDQSVDDRQRLQQQVEDLKVDLGNLQQRHVTLAKQKQELEWVISRAQEKVGPGVFEFDAMPKIDGSVVGVSNKVNLVVISIGEEDGVRAGFTLTVFRGNAFVGKLEVEQVYPKTAACRVLTEFTKDKVQMGDRVSTMVW